MIIQGRIGGVDLVLDTTGWPTPTKNMMHGGIASIIQKTPASVTITYLQQVYELLKDLPHGLNVLEMFGGIGLFPKIMGPTIKPAFWTSVDWDEWCKSNFMEPRATFVLKDVYEMSIAEISKYDLVITDNGYTLYKYWTQEKLFELMSTIAEARPTYWEVTDIGRYWSHLHKPQYKAVFGVDLTDKDSYTHLFAKLWKEWFNYDMVKNTYGGGAQYFLFKRG